MMTLIAHGFIPPPRPDSHWLLYLALGVIGLLFFGGMIWATRQRTT